ncbi:unnamed protein product [Adineta steineri]|uniref:RRM domain-containing protein n=1 Tax=Adineta steineri TaxID=433720 RepID=A0A819FGN1_9BILA|nr:unnamed protein product [Adineta steineri]CAF3867237.1 unnamed protein product [Adineta steineri]
MSQEPYWTITHGHANRTGWSCRECRTVIYQGEPIVIRDGRKLRLMYHEHCYSGGSDPRTQTGSSYHDQKWTNAQSIQEKAPPVKGHGKWSTEYGYKAAKISDENQTTKPLITSKLSRSSSNSSKTNSKPVTNNKLFVTGLLNLDEKDLSEHFAQVGSIEDVITIKDRAGRSRKFGFITFENYRSVHKCLKEKQTINGKQVNT